MTIENKVKEFEKNPCDYCMLDYEKHKLVNQYIIEHLEDKHLSINRINEFNDQFLIKYMPMRYECRDKDNQDYCKLWIKEFKEYFKI